jgi:hypothetical protein
VEPQGAQHEPGHLRASPLLPQSAISPLTSPQALRRLNGMIMPLFVGVPKAEQQKHKDL